VPTTTTTTERRNHLYKSRRSVQKLLPFLASGTEPDIMAFRIEESAEVDLWNRSPIDVDNSSVFHMARAEGSGTAHSIATK
jgi:hypothetical protein